jgi:hypothetical protein
MIGSIGVTYVAAEAAFAFVGLRYTRFHMD